MIDVIFYSCMWLLCRLAGVLCTTYQAVNEWIFVVLWPLFTLALMVVVVVQRLEIRRLRDRRQAR